MSTIISGTTFDSNGNPVAGVTVVLIGNTPSNSNKKISESTQSDVNGDYSFNLDDSVNPTNCYVSLEPEPIFDINNPPASNESVYFSSPMQYSSGAKKPSSLDFIVWSSYLVYGTITDSNTNSVPNAAVAINGYVKPGNSTSTINALNSYYYFYAQAGQDYTLTPTAAGYDAVSPPLQISSLSQTTQANFSMNENEEMSNITDWLQVISGFSEVGFSGLAAIAGFFYFMAKQNGWSCTTVDETNTVMSGIEMQEVTSFAQGQGDDVPADLSSVPGDTTMGSIQTGTAPAVDQAIVSQGLPAISPSTSNIADNTDAVVNSSSDLSESVANLNAVDVNTISNVANNASSTRTFQYNTNDAMSSAQEGQADSVATFPEDLTTVDQTFGSGEGSLADSAELAESGEATQVSEELLTSFYGEEAAAVSEAVEFVFDIGLVVLA